MSKPRKIPLDQPVRDRLVSDFGTNFLVEAGAGSGKTYSLATRMAAGIAAGTYTVEHLAVVTFTRKAAAELRGRFQLAVEERLSRKPAAEERERLETALAGMERLFAGTIHAFCAHLLRERPVDARVAPGFEELSDIDNLQRQRRAWRDFVAEARARGLQPMLDLLDAGIKPQDLYGPFATVCEHEDVEFDMGSGDAPDPKPIWKAVDKFWDELRALRADRVPRGHDLSRPAAVRRVRRPASHGAPGAAGVARRLLQARGGIRRLPRSSGARRSAGTRRLASRSRSSWPSSRQRSSSRSGLTWRAYIHRLAMAVLVEARDFYARTRRRDNVVNYVDLLRVTADMLRSRPVVRRALQKKYRRLFIDEFQDTDPIQAEIFLMLAADEAVAAAQDPSWPRPLRWRRPRPCVRPVRRPSASRRAVRRRRSQAVHLPLPPGRHRHLQPRGPAHQGDRRRGPRADGQFPVAAESVRTRERRLPAALCGFAVSVLAALREARSRCVPNPTCPAGPRVAKLTMPEAAKGDRACGSGGQAHRGLRPGRGGERPPHVRRLPGADAAEASPQDLRGGIRRAGDSR